MIITDELIDYIAALSKLEFKVEEKERVKLDFKSVIDHIEEIKDIDTTGIEPMTHIFDLYNVFRDDIESKSYNQDKIISNAPEAKNGFFVVPKTIE